MARSARSLSRWARIVAVAAVTLCGAGQSASQAVRPDRLQERGTILRRPIVPAQFRGHWSESLAACGADPVDESQAWISRSHVNFYETNGRVTRVVIADARHAVVTIEDAGEGITFRARKGLVLSPDRATLIMRDQDDTGSSRFRRCRNAPPR